MLFWRGINLQENLLNYSNIVMDATVSHKYAVFHLGISGHDYTFQEHPSYLMLIINTLFTLLFTICPDEATIFKQPEANPAGFYWQKYLS